MTQLLHIREDRDSPVFSGDNPILQKFIHLLGEADIGSRLPQGAEEIFAATFSHTDIQVLRTGRGRRQKDRRIENPIHHRVKDFEDVLMNGRYICTWAGSLFLESPVGHQQDSMKAEFIREIWQRV